MNKYYIFLVCICSFSYTASSANASYHNYMIYIHIFNCNWDDTRWQQYSTHWDDTRWQQYSTHLHTNNTQNTDSGTYITINKFKTNLGRSEIAMHHVTRHNTPIHNILSTAPQLSISQKALGTLPEDGNVMPKHVGATIHN
jgi:hypothetical protein